MTDPSPEPGDALTFTAEELGIARLAIEDVLIEYRDARIAMLRNNGLVVKEKDGQDSHVIRLGPEDAVRIGVEAIRKHRAARGAK